MGWPFFPKDRAFHPAAAKLLQKPEQIDYDRSRTRARWVRISRLNRRTALRIALVLLLLVGLLFAYQSGVLARFSDRATAQQTLLSLGGWGYLAFVLAYALLQPVGVPGTLFLFVAPLIWPFETALLLSTTGTMAASVIAFSFVRFVARDWLSPKIPARFARYNDALAHRAFVTIVLLRMVFWTSLPLHTFLGLSKVRFGTYFFGSLLGYLPILLGSSYFGPQLLLALKGMRWPGLVLLVLVAVGIGLWRWRAIRSPER